MVIQVQDKSEKLGVRACIYTRPGGSVLESSAASFENETKRLPCPSFGEVFLQHHFYGLKMKPNVCFFSPILRTENEHLPHTPKILRGFKLQSQIYMAATPP